MIRRSCLFAMMLVCASAAVAEDAQFFVSQDLGQIPGKQSESLPGEKLYAAIKANPDATVCLVTGTVAINANVKDHNKYFFDKSKRILVFMSRTAMPVGSDTFRWRIWHDVSPEDFKDGLPYGNDKLRTTPSPFRTPKASFPVKYPEHPEIIEWP